MFLMISAVQFAFFYFMRKLVEKWMCTGRNHFHFIYFAAPDLVIFLFYFNR